MPMQDKNGRWHDDRGRFMKVAAALAAAAKPDAGRGKNRGTLSAVAAKLAPAPQKSRGSARVPAAKLPSRTPERHRAALDAMTTREEATAYLAPIKGKELDALAREFSIIAPSVALKRSRIVETTVGSRRNSAVLSGNSWSMEHGATGGTGDVVHDLTDAEFPDEPRIAVREQRIKDLRAEITRNRHSLRTDASVQDRRSELTDRNTAAQAEIDALSQSRPEVPKTRRVAAEAAVRDAYPKVQAESGSSYWTSIADLRTHLDAAGFTRDEQDAAFRSLVRQPDMHLIPVADQKNLDSRARADAFHLGVERVDVLGIGEEHRQTSSEPTVDDLRSQLANRERVLAIDTEAGLPDELLANHRAAIADLRKRIGSEGGGTSPPAALSEAEVRASVGDAYARLAAGPNDLVSLVRIRAALPDIPREDLDRVLKRMDRERVAQLSPDPNRKALPQEARDAAVRMGGDGTDIGAQQHFLSFPRMPKRRS